MDTIAPQPQPERQVLETPTGALNHSQPLTTYDVKEYFQILPYTESETANYISQFLQDRGIYDKGTAFQVLRDIENRLGRVEDRPNAIRNYLKVLNQIEDIQKIKSSMEHGTQW